MELARSIAAYAALLTWQWLVLILAIFFYRPIGRLFGRIRSINAGSGKSRIEVKLGLPKEAGRVIELGEAKIQERIDARLIVLRDRDGKERAKLGMTDLGEVSFTMHNSDGQPLVQISTVEDIASIYFMEDSGQRIMMLAAGARDGSVLFMQGSEKGAFARIVVDKEAFLSGVNDQGDAMRLGTDTQSRSD